MGVDFICGSLSLKIGYGRFDAVKASVIRATVIYLREYVQIDSYLEQTSRQTILDVLYDVQEGLQITELYKTEIIDIMTHFGIVGLYAFFNKNDCDAEYSPGNSLDICILLDRLRDILIKTDINSDVIYEYDNCLYNIFEKSYLTMNNVLIL
jgi:hypothetical protein